MPGILSRMARMARLPLLVLLPLLVRLAEMAGIAGTRCPVCSVLTSGPGTPLCADCALALRPRRHGCCVRCGDMFGDSADHAADGSDDLSPAPAVICAECRLDPPPWERLHFHGAYSGALRDLIIDYKFHGGLHRTRLLTSLAAEALRHSADTPGREPCDVIVPVPLHPRRLVARGYNQSIELARGLGRSAGLPVVADALRRTRNTAPQLSLDRHERRENIRDAFAASPARVHGRRVLLVDDVYTTGATLTECARTLLAAGAAGVDVLVLARARREPE